MKRLGIALAWLLLFAVVAVPIIIGISNAVPGWGGENWFFVRNGAYEVIGFGIATLVVGRLLNRHSWDSMGWRPRPRAGVAYARGLGLGVAMAIAATLGAVVLDRASLHITGDWNGWAPVALPLMLGLILAALGEELAFRGYPLRRLAEAVGPLPAMLVLAVLFGLAHAKNPNATVFSIVNVALAAIWLSIAFFSQGGIALAWGAHFGWNAGLAILFDAPVSGFRFEVPVVEYAPGNHPWVDGGAFGPEGGIVTTIALVAGTLYLLTRKAAFSDQPSVEQQQVAAA